MFSSWRAARTNYGNMKIKNSRSKQVQQIKISNREHLHAIPQLVGVHALEVERSDPLSQRLLHLQLQSFILSSPPLCLFSLSFHENVLPVCFALHQSKIEHNKYGRSNGRWSIIEESLTCSLDLLPWPAGSTGASGFFTFNIISAKYFYFLSKLIRFSFFVRDHFEFVHNTPLSLFEEEIKQMNFTLCRFFTKIFTFWRRKKYFHFV